MRVTRKGLLSKAHLAVQDFSNALGALMREGPSMAMVARAENRSATAHRALLDVLLFRHTPMTGKISRDYHDIDARYQRLSIELRDLVDRLKQ